MHNFWYTFQVLFTETFDKYKWPDPVSMYNGRIERLLKILPEGMKFIVQGPGGVLENVK